MIVVDAYAWFEYFFGTAKGTRLKSFLESGEVLLTPSVVLYEVKNKLVREGKNPKDFTEHILKCSIIEPLSAEVALRAVDVRTKYKLNTSDAFIYATAVEKKCPVLTGDKHFEKLPNVVLIA